MSVIAPRTANDPSKTTAALSRVAGCAQAGGFGPKARHALWLKKAGGKPLPPALTFRGRMPVYEFATGEQAKSAGPYYAVGRGHHDVKIRRNYLSKLNLFSRTNQSL